MKAIYLALIILTGVAGTYAIDWQPGIDEFVVNKDWLLVTLILIGITVAWFFCMRSKGISPYKENRDDAE